MFFNFKLLKQFSLKIVFFVKKKRVLNQEE